VQIDSSGSDGVFAINSSHNIYRFISNETFVQIPGELVQITSGIGGGTWGINASNEVFRFVDVPPIP
jgi:hypothetical protein